MEHISAVLIWGALGALLIIAEVMTGTFVALCVGIGALTTMGAILALPDMALTSQLILWAISTSLYTVLFFAILKPRMVNRTAAGDPMIAVRGRKGCVTDVETADSCCGTIQFSQPLLGSRHWRVVSDQSLIAGQDMIVENLDGNTLIVQSIKEE